MLTDEGAVNKVRLTNATVQNKTIANANIIIKINTCQRFIVVPRCDLHLIMSILHKIIPTFWNFATDAIVLSATTSVRYARIPLACPTGQKSWTHPLVCNGKWVSMLKCLQAHPPTGGILTAQCAVSRTVAAIVVGGRALFQQAL